MIAVNGKQKISHQFHKQEPSQKNIVKLFSRHVSYPAEAICNGGESLRICTKTALAFVSGNTNSSYHIVILEKIFDKGTDDFDIVTTECDVKISEDIK